jgi:hypothetical protein
MGIPDCPVNFHGLIGVQGLHGYQAGPIKNPWGLYFSFQVMAVVFDIGTPWDIPLLTPWYRLEAWL